MINRSTYLEKISECFTTHPVIAILGPRQCGKTTLAELYAKESFNNNSTITRFDLEDPRDIARLETPMLALENLEGLIIIDEIQLRPNLFPVLRVLVDKYRKKQRYLILGSASRDLIQQSSETLAGRITYIELSPLSISEVNESKQLWLRGGFPPSYLASNNQRSLRWRQEYIRTFLERDIPNLGIRVPAQTLRRFWMMLLHYHGNTVNSSELARSLGWSNTRIQHYLDILSGTFMIRQLSPWHENLSKRQVKAKKIYFRDSGIMHSLMGIESGDALTNHPRLGASWEGFALEEIIRYHNIDSEECYFWAVHSGAKLDLLIFKGGKRLGFEFKYSDQPKFTKSMAIANEDLKLDNLTVVVPGDSRFPLRKNNIGVCGLDNYIV